MTVGPVCPASQLGHVYDGRPDVSFLLDAAARGDAMEVERRVADGQDVNACDVSGSVCVCVCVCVCVYVGGGRCVETNGRAQPLTGFTSLHVATDSGNVDVVRLLLKLGADVTQVCVRSRTVVFRSAPRRGRGAVTAL